MLIYQDLIIKILVAVPDRKLKLVGKITINWKVLREKMIYLYSTTEPTENHSEISSEVKQYLSKQGLTVDKHIQDPESNKIRWDKRQLMLLITRTMKNGDILVAYEAANLACSTLQLLEILEQLAERDLVLKLIKHEETFLPDEMADTQDFLHLVQNIEGEFVAHRTTDALAKRREAGLPLGRPKGRKNKSRKLDRHKSEIKKYMALNISKASIAKLLGCHPQTLYNYLEENNMLSDDGDQDE